MDAIADAATCSFIVTTGFVFRPTIFAGRIDGNHGSRFRTDPATFIVYQRLPPGTDRHGEANPTPNVSVRPIGMMKESGPVPNRFEIGRFVDDLP